MRTLKSLAMAEVGQRLQFAYYGGTDIGAARTVDVEEVGEDRIYGTDVAKGEPRWYMFDRAASVQVVAEAPTYSVTDKPAPAADAACNVSPVEPSTSTCVRCKAMSFVEARQRLHEQIDNLNGEDLAEVLAEVDGEDRGRFDNGRVILERDVFVPHYKVTDDGIEFVNEDGIAVLLHVDGDNVLVDGDELSVNQIICCLGNHLGLTVHENVL